MNPAIKAGFRKHPEAAVAYMRPVLARRTGFKRAIESSASCSYCHACRRPGQRGVLCSTNSHAALLHACWRRLPQLFLYHALDSEPRAHGQVRRVMAHPRDPFQTVSSGVRGQPHIRSKALCMRLAGAPPFGTRSHTLPVILEMAIPAILRTISSIATKKISRS